MNYHTPITATTVINVNTRNEYSEGGRTHQFVCGQITNVIYTISTLIIRKMRPYNRNFRHRLSHSLFRRDRIWTGAVVNKTLKLHMQTFEGNIAIRGLFAPSKRTGCRNVTPYIMHGTFEMTKQTSAKTSFPLKSSSFRRSIYPD